MDRKAVKVIIAGVDAFTLVKLEARARVKKLTLEEYVSSFLDKWVEPISPTR